MIHILSLFVFSFLLSTVEGARVRVSTSWDLGSSVSEFFCTTDSCEGWQLAVTISSILFVVLVCCCTFRWCPCYDILRQIVDTILFMFFFVLCCCGCCGNCNKATWDEEWSGLGAERREERQRRTEQQELRMTETV